MNRRARTTDPVTAWAAARRTTPELDNGLRNLCLQALARFGPLTHDELIDVVQAVRPASPSGVRTRVIELVRLGLVEAHPSMFSKSRLGRTAILWRVVE